MADKTVWEVAQEGERNWWFGGVHDSARAYEEQQKQITYAEKMGLELGADGMYDLKGMSVLDIGGGPVSLLLKCKNFSKAKVVDPMDMPEWVIQRYTDAGIGYQQIKGEDCGERYEDKGWDEVWIYNVLLHTEDPHEVIKRAQYSGFSIRIFEWINTTKNDMHPHVLTKEQLDKWLGRDGTAGYVPDGDSEFYSAVVEKPEGTGYLGPQGDGNSGSQADCGTDITGSQGLRHKRFHLPGLPHVATNQKEALACAFSQKVIKMAKMLKSMGHTVYFYGVEGSEVECDEFIQVSTQAVLKETYGDYDMKKVTYKHAQGDIAYQTFNENAIPTIRERMQPNDFLLIPFAPQRYKMILEALDTKFVDRTDRLHLIVEMGIGYRGTQCRFKVFESISQQHLNYGLSSRDGGATLNGNFYDAVIPNYFDPDDFEYSDKKKDYFLFLGRVVHRKGVAFAIKTCEAIGTQLIVAGQDGEEGVDLSSPNVEYVGFADVEKRKELLRDAKGLFLPTQYVEPFGGVIIEAAFSGTPVITSNWGAFPELVDHGKTGYRCCTLDQFVWAAKNIGNIKPLDCYNYAMDNFSLDRVRLMYEEYFNMLLDVKENVNGKGWNRLHPERTQLDWLNKVRDYG